MRLFNQTTAECSNLWSVLESIQPESARMHLFNRILPYEIQIIHARAKYWSGDHYGYLDELTTLLRLCKRKARKSISLEEKDLWKERAARTGMVMASQLLEMQVKYLQVAQSQLSQIPFFLRTTEALKH